MLRLQSVLGLSLVLVSSSLAGQPQSEKVVTEREGQVRKVHDSPIELSEARWVAETRDGSKTFEAVAHSVRIKNISGRSIRRLNLMFIHRFNECGSAGLGDSVDSVGPHEVRDVSRTDFKIPVSNLNGGELLIMATGVEFDDGSYWAPNRRESGLLVRSCLSNLRSPLMMRTCEFKDGLYTVDLEVTDPKIQSYTLGMVRDTADNFEVKIGTRIALEESQRVRGAHLTDNCRSVKADHLFPQELLPAGFPLSPNCPKSPAGVAIFVAEVTFSDGHSWVQDTDRDALMWDN
jgi:hypothetical protein